VVEARVQFVEARFQHRDILNGVSQAPGPRPKAQGQPASDTLAFFILAAALVLRFWGLGDKNLWLDEAASWTVATSDWPEFWRVVTLDIHPPLYYLLLKGWVAIFGDGVAAMRSLSAIASVAALWCAYLLARRFLPRPVALAVLGLLAISPHQLYYAQEARMYALATVAVLAGTLAWVRWIDSEGQSRAALTGFALAAAAALYLHYFSALWFASIVLFTVLWRPAQDRGAVLRRFGLALAGIAVLYVPWVAVAVAHFVRGQPWRAAVDLEGLPFQLWSFVAQLFVGYYTATVKLRHGGALILAFAFVGIVALAVVSRRRSKRETSLLLVVTLVPMVLGIASLFRAGAMDLARYLGYSLPFVAIAAARGWTDLLRTPRRAALILALAAAALLPATSAYFGDPSRDSDIRPLIRAIENRGGMSPPVPVLVGPGYMSILLKYYRPGWTAIVVDDAGSFRAELGRLAAAGDRRWAIVDYRLTGADAVVAESGLERIAVPASRDEKMRLFRTR
jgi:4-amino-4-deoxy-L-arabinose transferase-like glycosyltransferase